MSYANKVESAIDYDYNTATNLLKNPLYLLNFHKN